MSDEYNIDDNNNDGTSTCRVTRFINCCDSNKFGRHSCKPQSKDSSSKDDFCKERDYLLTSLNSSGNHFSTVKPLGDHHVNSKEVKNLENTFKSDTSQEESSSEKENSSGDNQPKSAPIKIWQKSSLRGILKYPPGWRRRAFSESSAVCYSASSCSDDNGFFGTSLDSPDILFEFEDDCVDEDGQDKPKKNVTFSDKMATFVFRPNSSILGRRLKNQKKAKRKKDKKTRNSLECFPSENDEFFLGCKDEVEAARLFIAMQRSPLMDTFDSNSDVSSSSGCDCSASDCSGDETPAEVVNRYENESTENDNTKAKRKNRRKRNRKNKQNVRTKLETLGYDSD